MPLYDYRCDKCNHVERDKFRRAVMYKTPFMCPECKNGWMLLTLEPPEPEKAHPRPRVRNVFDKV